MKYWLFRPNQILSWGKYIDKHSQLVVKYLLIWANWTEFIRISKIVHFKNKKWYIIRCSCGEDGTVRLFDLRQISRCHKTCCKDNILILSPSAVTAMCMSPLSNNYIAIGSSDSIIRIYDRRFLALVDFSVPGSPSDRHTVPVKAFTIPSYEKRPFRVTSVTFSHDECELLVSYSSDHLYLFNLLKEVSERVLSISIIMPIC